jgi:hypothetical protein
VLLVRLLLVRLCGFAPVLLLRLLVRSCPWCLFWRVLLAFGGVLFLLMATAQWCFVVFVLLRWLGAQLVFVQVLRDCGHLLALVGQLAVFPYWGYCS